MMFIRTALVSSWLLLASLALASEQSLTPAAELAAQLQAQPRISADFRQYTLAEGNSREESSSGHFVLEHPDLFRWETQSPFPQLVVSDGQQLWIYDPDLEQVTLKAMGEQGMMTPAAVLAGDLEQINRHFLVARLPAGQGEQLYELRPQDSTSAEFQRLRLFFSGQGLSELLIEDGLGQRSLIMLENVDYPQQLDPGLFQFEPPEGVDLIEDRPR